MSTAFDEHPYPNKSVFMNSRPEWVMGPTDASQLARRRRSLHDDDLSFKHRPRTYSRSRSRPRQASYSEEEKRGLALTPRRFSSNDRALDRRRPSHPYRPRRYSSTSSSSSSSSESSDSDSDRERDRPDWATQQKHKRNKRMLFTGMAVVSTCAAATNVYQGHLTRQENREKEVSKGRVSKEEHMKRKKKHLMQNAMALGVAGICLNNARRGWQRVKKLEA